MKYPQWGGHVAIHTLFECLSRIRNQGARHPTNLDDKGARRVPIFVFRYRQLSFQTIRDRQKHYDSRRRHPNF